MRWQYCDRASAQQWLRWPYSRRCRSRIRSCKCLQASPSGLPQVSLCAPHNNNHHLTDLPSHFLHHLCSTTKPEPTSNYHTWSAAEYAYAYPAITNVPHWRISHRSRGAGGSFRLLLVSAITPRHSRCLAFLAFWRTALCRLTAGSLSTLCRRSLATRLSALGLRFSVFNSRTRIRLTCLAFACPADLPLSRCFLCFSGCPLRSPPPGRRYPSPLHLREPRSPRLLFSVRSSSYSTLPLFPLSPPPPPPPRPALTCQP